MRGQQPVDAFTEFTAHAGTAMAVGTFSPGLGPVWVVGQPVPRFDRERGVSQRPVHHRSALSSMRHWVAVSMIALSAGAHAQAHPEYTIKEDAPRTGSSIRRNQVMPIQIAYNLPYAQLPESDKQAVHRQYDAIAQGDEPPFPVDKLRAVLNPIRKAQQRLLVTGELLLVATIGPDGQAQQVKAYGSPSPEMTTFAAQTLMLVSYKPAVCGGQPCTMDFPLNMKFVLQ